MHRKKDSNFFRELDENIEYFSIGKYAKVLKSKNQQKTSTIFVYETVIICYNENDWRYPNEKKDYYDTCADRSHYFSDCGGIWDEIPGAVFLLEGACGFERLFRHYTG